MKQAAAGLAVRRRQGRAGGPHDPAPGSTHGVSCCCATGRSSTALHGTYVTAADMNTGPADLDVMQRAHVPRDGHEPGARRGGGLRRRHRDRGVPRDPRERGHAFGDPSLEGRTVLVQGVGSVGGRLARLARGGRGDSSRSSDVDGDRVTSVAAELGASIAPPDLVPRTPLRRIRPLRHRGRAERRNDPAAPVSRRGGRREQPARHAGGRRTPRRPWHPLRARLRRERRRRAPPGRLRGTWAGTRRRWPLDWPRSR